MTNSMTVDDRVVILKEIHRRLPSYCNMEYEVFDLSKVFPDVNHNIPMLTAVSTPLGSIHIDEDSLIMIRLPNLTANVNLFTSPDPVQEVIDHLIGQYGP
jgi:hypothetical protein